MSNLKNCLFFAISEWSRFFVVCLLQTNAKIFYDQTRGQPTPHITDRGVSTVTLGCVGGLNERVSCRFHDGVVGFGDRCLPMILIKVGSSLQSLPEQRFYVHCAARNSSPRKLSRDVQNLPNACENIGVSLIH